MGSRVVFALWLTFLRRKNTARVSVDHLVFSLHRHTVLLLLAICRVALDLAETLFRR